MPHTPTGVATAGTKLADFGNLNATSLRQLLTTYDIQPKKQLGQHFLHDESVVADMLSAANLCATDTALEIGPGVGVLTSALCQRAAAVYSVELDTKLAGLLREQNIANLTVIEGDALEVSLPPDGVNTYKILANIPYNITGQLLRRFVALDARPQSVTVLIQKEVAERIVAGPGQMSVLAVALQLHGTPSLVRLVPPDAFWPAPKVDSAILHIDLAPKLTLPVDEAAFMRLVKFGFAQKRKQLKNTLAAGLHYEPTELEPFLEQVGLKVTVRAQELSLAQWQALYQALRTASII